MDCISENFEKTYNRKPDVICFAPGRVNLIGEHTDYNGGHVFPCAIQYGIKCAAAARNDRILRFFSRNMPQSGIAVYDLDDIRKKGCWADYPAGVIRAFSSFGRDLKQGADFYYYGDLPTGAGLSSSAAMEVVTGTILKKLFSTDVTRQEIALIGQFAENRFIGVNCGIMDQFASAMGKKGCAVLLDSNTLEYGYAPLSGASLVIVNSKVKHSLASSAYNTRRRECETAMSALGVPALCLMTPDEFESKKRLINDERCLKRARHAVYEEKRTLDAAKALNDSDMELFGRLMNGSHRSLKEDYEVSCAELDFLAETAQSLPYVYGARMTGGGFGGCTVNLIESGNEKAFGQFIKTEYEKTFGITPDVYPVQAAEGAYAE